MRRSVVVFSAVVLLGCESLVFYPDAQRPVAKEPVPSPGTPEPMSEPGDPDPIGQPKVMSESMYVLSRRHIQRTLEVSFGLTASLNFAEPSLGFFEANRLAAVQSLSDFDGFFAATEQLLATQLGRFLSCEVQQLTEACLRTSLERAGRKLLRRRLTSQELDRAMQIATSRGPAELAQGARYAFISLLNAPDFLYQRFVGQAGQLTDRELASRVAFFLLGGNPDEALLDAAERGDLRSPEGLTAQVDRLLTEPTRREVLFADTLMEVWRASRNHESVAASTLAAEIAPLEADFAEEFRRTAMAVARDGDWRAALNGGRVVVNRKLALHYGLTPVPETDATWQSVATDESRAGLLSSGQVLVAHSGSKFTSTIHRGLFTVNDLLCRSIKSPANLQDLIAQSGVTLSETDTVRERVDRMVTTQPCAGCHAQFDPYGLVYEHFDPLGRYASIRWGSPVDSRTTIEGKPVETLGDLAKVLLEDADGVSDCFFRKVYGAATGTPAQPGGALVPAFGLTGEDRFDFSKLARAIVTHESFRRIATP